MIQNDLHLTYISIVILLLQVRVSLYCHANIPAPTTPGCRLYTPPLQTTARKFVTSWKIKRWSFMITLTWDWPGDHLLPYDSNGPHNSFLFAHHVMTPYSAEKKRDLDGWNIILRVNDYIPLVLIIVASVKYIFISISLKVSWKCTYFGSFNSPSSDLIVT